MPRFLALLTVGAILAFAPSVALAANTVDGTVTQKFFTTGDDGEGTQPIAVDGTLYLVPLSFYLTANVGDVVHFDGENWVVVSP